MKIATAIVLYNPNLKVLENIKVYLDFVEKLLILDNSEQDISLEFQKVLENEKIKYIPFRENKGIAYALKYACDIAISAGYDFLLTMDQDSRLTAQEYNQAIMMIEKIHLDDVGLICMNTTEFKELFSPSKEIIEVSSWITSGSFLHLKNYQKIEGFNPNLFIDLVDFDLCHKFIKAKFKILLLNHVCLNHTIGNPIRKKFLFKTIYSSNHSALRYYYIFRNDYYLYKQDKAFFKSIHKNHCKDIFRMLLVEKNKFKKLKMIKKGIKDAKKGKLGKYQE